MKQKRKLWNLLMVVAIVAIAVIGVFSVGKLKGWFGTNGITVTKEDGTEETVTLVERIKSEPLMWNEKILHFRWKMMRTFRMVIFWKQGRAHRSI